MDIDDTIKNNYLEFNVEKEKCKQEIMGVWFTDLNKGISLEVKGESVRFTHYFLENVNHSIEIEQLDWKKIIAGELTIYDAIISGKVTINGDHWEVIHFFDYLKY